MRSSTCRRRRSPAGLRWLILSDNRIAALPESLGDCARLQKLALAGNRLAALPAGIARCGRLELVRLSANRFARWADALPDGLLALPNLSWLAYAGNPFNAGQEAGALETTPIAQVPWAELEVGALLGAGASGHIHAARWRPAGGAERAVAVKLFKGRDHQRRAAGQRDGRVHRGGRAREPHRRRGPHRRSPGRTGKAW